MSTIVTARLMPHPDAAGPLRDVSVAVWREARDLRLRYRFEGDLARVRVPAPGAPGFTLGLWEHTCAEAFVATAGAAAYHELNFSPSGAWAVFAFHDYRELGSLAGDPAPRIDFRAAADAFEVDAVVDLEELSPRYAGDPLALGLSAVVEDVDGGISYWSLLHPPGKADFHHSSTRALSLAAPASRSAV